MPPIETPARTLTQHQSSKPRPPHAPPQSRFSTATAPCGRATPAPPLCTGRWKPACSAPNATAWLNERYRLYRAGAIDELAICGEMVQVYQGMPVGDTSRRAAADFFRTRIEPHIFAELRNVVAALQARGTEIWAVSSTNDWVIEEGVKRFGIPAGPRARRAGRQPRRPGYGRTARRADRRGQGHRARTPRASRARARCSATRCTMPPCSPSRAGPSRSTLRRPWPNAARGKAGRSTIRQLGSPPT